MLINDDCLVAMKRLESESIDSLVTDPPAGISFMGKGWDSDKGGRDEWIKWMASVMRECHRVLKPGAHGLVWALPRTSHWTATACEDAGFEIRDIVHHLFGSGFPKSLDISKAIDKAAGAEREVVGTKERPGGFDRGQLSNKNFGNIHSPDSGAITAPATDAAKQWAGWGTALKPAAENWILVRKPCSEKTVAANVLKHGTGGINIDAGRIATADNLNGGAYSPGERERSESAWGGGIGGGVMSGAGKPFTQPQGRFPANLVFSHSPNCTEEACDMFECAVALLDEQSGKLGPGPKKPAPGNTGVYQTGFKVTEGVGYGDKGGASRFFYSAKISSRERNEGVKDLLTWEGQDQNLQDRTAELSQLARDISADTLQSIAVRLWSIVSCGKSTSDRSPKDSTFTIETVSKLITDLKTWNFSPSFSIRESIQDAIRTIEANGLSLAEAAASISQSPNSTSAEMDTVTSVSNALLLALSEIRKLARSGNIHITVKPKKLMTYLIKLITPPGGIVLDCFMGSGSTGLAAKEAGFSFVGIEREPEYFAIAEARIDNS